LSVERFGSALVPAFHRLRGSDLKDHRVAKPVDDRRAEREADPPLGDDAAPRTDIFRD